MKNSKQLIPKRRFKEFENDREWEQNELGETAELFSGYSFKSQDSTKEGIKWLKIANVGIGKIRWEDRSYLPINYKEKHREYLLFEDDLVVALTRPIINNKIKLANIERKDEPALLNQRVGKIIPISRRSDTTFLKYLISHKKTVKALEKSILGTEPPNISKNNFEELTIILPALEEQQKIGSFLKEFDGMIQLQQSKINKAKYIKSSYLSDMFPKEGEKYPKKRFEEFTEPWKRNDIEFLAGRYDNLRVPVTASNRIPGNTPYYGANGIQDFVEGFTHEGEYILIAEDGANDLKDYPVHYVNGKIWVNNHAHVLQAKEGVADNKFLMYALKTIDMEPYLVGGGRAKLNANIMMDIKISVPNIKEQKKISELFFKIDKLIEKEEQKLEKLKQIKQAYLNELFV